MFLISKIQENCFFFINRKQKLLPNITLLTYVYKFFIDICLYCVLFEIKNLFYLLVFSTHVVMHFFSVLGNIQVDSIELLSTLATDG